MATPLTLSPQEQELTNAYHNLYYNKRFGPHQSRIWEQTYWMGYPTLKQPSDLWIYQELLFEIKPDLIIETGTYASGTTLYLAHLCDITGKGEIVSIDITELSVRARHPRITYITGSSTDPSLVQSIFTRFPNKETVMVILDSDHTKEHVQKEMLLFAPRVTLGSYLIVEDSNVNGHPVYPSFGPGPYEAIEEFLVANNNFAVDKGREKFMVTWNPNGYLKKIR